MRASGFESRPNDATCKRISQSVGLYPVVFISDLGRVYALCNLLQPPPGIALTSVPAVVHLVFFRVVVRIVRIHYVVRLMRRITTVKFLVRRNGFCKLKHGPHFLAEEEEGDT